MFESWSFVGHRQRPFCQWFCIVLHVLTYWMMFVILLIYVRNSEERKTQILRWDLPSKEFRKLLHVDRHLQFIHLMCRRQMLSHRSLLATKKIVKAEIYMKGFIKAFEIHLLCGVFFSFFFLANSITLDDLHCSELTIIRWSPRNYDFAARTFTVRQDFNVRKFNFHKKSLCVAYSFL